MSCLGCCPFVQGTKAVVLLLLLVHCFMYLPLFVGVLRSVFVLVYITLCPF